MRVLAVDPGYDRLGIAVIEKQSGKETVLHSDCVTTDKKADFPDRLHTLGQAFEALIEKYEPGTVAIEKLFFNQNQKTAMAVAEVRGALIYIAKKHGCAVKEFGPQEIKVAVTGHGGSDKQAVTDMLKHLVKNLPLKALDDEYDAIAIGVTALAHHR